MTLKTSDSTCIGASEFEVLQAIQQEYLFFQRGCHLNAGLGSGPGTDRGRSLSFCKECCFMVRVRVRHGFRFWPDAGRNVRLSEIIIFLSVKIIFFHLLTKERLDPYFTHLVM